MGERGAPVGRRSTGRGRPARAAPCAQTRARARRGQPRARSGPRSPRCRTSGAPSGRAADKVTLRAVERSFLGLSEHARDEAEPLSVMPSGLKRRNNTVIPNSELARRDVVEGHLERQHLGPPRSCSPSASRSLDRLGMTLTFVSKRGADSENVETRLLPGLALGLARILIVCALTGVCHVQDRGPRHAQTASARGGRGGEQNQRRNEQRNGASGNGFAPSVPRRAWSRGGLDESGSKHTGRLPAEPDIGGPDRDMPCGV